MHKTSISHPLYSNIYRIAVPYYKKARKFDLEHIDWLLSVSDEVIMSEKLDATIMIPLVILHDIGYTEIDESFWGKETRKAHMEKGAALTQNILESIAYDRTKTLSIVHYVAIHDEWALGNNVIYKNDRLLANFTDLDFAWMASAIGFPFFMEELKKTKMELIAWLENNEKLVNRPFASKSTSNLFYSLINERKQD